MNATRRADNSREELRIEAEVGAQIESNSAGANQMWNHIHLGLVRSFEQFSRIVRFPQDLEQRLRKELNSEMLKKCVRAHPCLAARRVEDLSIDAGKCLRQFVKGEGI